MNAIPNRVALLASVNAPTPDAISFAGLIDGRADDLRSVARDVYAALAARRVPGEGTCQELDRIAMQLAQAAAHWRAGRA